MYQGRGDKLNNKMYDGNRRVRVITRRGESKENHISHCTLCTLQLFARWALPKERGTHIANRTRVTLTRRRKLKIPGDPEPFFCILSEHFFRHTTPRPNFFVEPQHGCEIDHFSGTVAGIELMTTFGGC